MIIYIPFIVLIILEIALIIGSILIIYDYLKHDE